MKNIELTAKHRELVASLGEEEILSFMKNRPVLSKLNRFGTYGSRKRKELFVDGYLTYAYCYKTFGENENRFRANIIFSPDAFATDHPEILAAAYKKLRQFKMDFDLKYISRNRENRRLYNDLFSEENDPKFVSIPDIYSEGIFIQLSIVEFEANFSMPADPGNFYLLICFNPKITDIVMPYPDEYLAKLMEL